MLSLLDNLSSLDCLYIYIRCKGHKRWKLANRMSDGTMLTRKFNPSIRRRFFRSHRWYSRKLYDFGQSRVTNLYPTFCNRIGNILPKTTESGATFSSRLVSSRKAEKIRTRNLLRGQVTIKVVANLHSPEKRICHEICILDNVFWIWEFLQEERYNADTPIGKIIVDEAWIPKAKRPSSRIQHVRLCTKKHANHVPKASTDSN